MDIARQRVVPKNRLCPCVPHSLRAPSERPKTSLSASLTSLTRLQTEIDRERAVPMDALRDPEKDEDRCLDPKARFCMLRSLLSGTYLEPGLCNVNSAMQVHLLLLASVVVAEQRSVDGCDHEVRLSCHLQPICCSVYGTLESACNSFLVFANG